MEGQKKVKTCKLTECNIEFIDHTGKQVYCCRKHQNRSGYLKNEARLAKLRRIPKEIDDVDKIIEKLHKEYGSNPIPMWRAKEDKLENIDYCMMVQHPELKIHMPFFLDYGIYFDVANQTFTIYTRDELQED